MPFTKILISNVFPNNINLIHTKSVQIKFKIAKLSQ